MKTQPATVPPEARKACHRSKSKIVRHPGSFLAAKDLGVHRAHLHRVLTGERSSPTLLKKWRAWLRANPDFARLNRRKAKP